MYSLILRESEKYPSIYFVEQVLLAYSEPILPKIKRRFIQVLVLSFQLLQSVPLREIKAKIAAKEGATLLQTSEDEI